MVGRYKTQRKRWYNSRFAQSDKRLVFLEGMLLLSLLVIVWRIFNLQILSHQFYSAVAAGQYEFVRDLFPKRGSVYLQNTALSDESRYETKNLTAIATNREYWRVYAVPSEVVDAKNTSEKLAEFLEGDLNGGSGNIPLLAYYPVNRAVLDIPLKIRVTHDFNPLDAFDGALTRAANFRVFFEWFRNREDFENEQRRDIPSFLDPSLDAVRTAIQTFMQGCTNLRVRRNPRGDPAGSQYVVRFVSG
jgi:cell division protein FtsI/penicillin-binding protein 2